MFKINTVRQIEIKDKKEEEYRYLHCFYDIFIGLYLEG